MRRATLAAAILGLTQWLVLATATAAPQVTIAYGDAPASDAALVHAHDVLVKSQALDELELLPEPAQIADRPPHPQRRLRRRLPPPLQFGDQDGDDLLRNDRPHPRRRQGADQRQ